MKRKILSITMGLMLIMTMLPVTARALSSSSQVSISIDDGVANAVPGTTQAYTITVTNDPGSVNESGVAVFCTLPPSQIQNDLTPGTENWTATLSGGANFAVGAPSSGKVHASTGADGEPEESLITIVDLPAGGSVTMTLTVQVATSTTGTLTVEASITGDFAKDSDTDTLTPQADLAVTIDDSKTSFDPGASTVYMVTVTNAGPSKVVAASLACPLSAGAADSAWGPKSYAENGYASPMSGTGALSSNVDLDAGGSYNFWFRVDTDPGATGVLSATATITAPASVTDPAASNNSATDTNGFATTYTVTFNSDGSVYTTKTVNAGQSIGSAAWPADPTRSSYTFAGWFTGENGAGAQLTSATPVSATTTVYAKWTYSGGGDGGGSSTPSTPSTPTYKADIKAGNGTGTTLPVMVDKNAGTASIDVGSASFAQGGTVITIPSIPDVDTVSFVIPIPDLSAADVQGTLTLTTDAGSVTVPSDMLTGVKLPDGSSGISGRKAEISIGQGKKDNLPDDVKAAIGDKPLIQLTLSIDGKQTDWSNPNAPVTVSIPYTPTAAELTNPESIVIWYIDGSGNIVTIPDGHYDSVTSTVTFNTTHFSDYAVAYNKVSFTDVPAGAWYAPAVSFIAAREITSGTGNGNYSPDAKLTRGEFIVLMMRAYGIAPDTNPTDSFSDAGNTYYTGYLAAAKRLGISTGVGNNLYAPDKEIARQEMFTLLYNALKAIGHLPQGDSGEMLSDFTDAGQVDSWAVDAVTLLVETGTVGGSGRKLAPTGTTTRGEMAQVLYNLLGK